MSFEITGFRHSSVIVLFSLVVISCAVAQYSGGSGTADDPYQIATAADLITLGETPDDYDKHFILTADIDLDPNLPRGRVFRTALIASEPYVADRFMGTPFTGVFDGNHHTISHLTIEGERILGLFGVLGDGARIANLGLEAVDINGTGTSVGGLAGGNVEGSITGCWSSGMVTGNRYVGGLAGSNYSRQDYSTVTGCYSTATVQGISLVGGLFGVNEGTVSNCHSAGVVVGEDCVGGLVGQNASETERGLILHCYSTAQVDGSDRVGGLVGKNWDKLFDCHSTGAVTGVNQVGGLIGYTLGYLKDEGAVQCYSTSSVTGGDRVGGLVGENLDKLFDCHSTGAVTGGNQVGGLVGANVNELAQCYSTSSVTGSDAVGGLVGANVNELELAQCYSTGPVTGKRHVGGLVGENGLSTKSGSWPATITDSYATSSVDGMANVGGLVGYQIGGSSVDSCYSTGMVSGIESVGGLVGSYQTGSVMASFWDIETSGQAESGGGIGLTTAEMQTASTFLEAGWDFINETENGLNGIWEIIEGQTYPLLSWRRYGGGTGEPNNPYLIYTVEHLNALGAKSNDYDKHFKLTANIDLSAYSYDRAVIASDATPDNREYRRGEGYRWPFDGTSFRGVFDGDGHTISHLTITGESWLGLFGQLGSTAVVTDLGLESVDVNGLGDAVGALVGSSHGCVTGSYSTGLVSAAGAGVGGLVGVSSAGEETTTGVSEPGAIIACCSTVAVTGGQTAGGLVGSNGGLLSNSCGAGSVSGESTVGGLVGHNYGTIAMCYSAGPVTGYEVIGGLVGDTWEDAAITASFWDVDISGQPTSNGGIGLTTAEMQTASTFLEAGWDFIDETENGTEDIWWILEGQDYPKLWWELDD